MFLAVKRFSLQKNKIQMKLLKALNMTECHKMIWVPAPVKKLSDAAQKLITNHTWAASLNVNSLHIY
jgi:hypothetical protein